VSLERVGLAVSERFLERLNVIPNSESEKAEPIAAATLRLWAANHVSEATQNAKRVMPLDVLFLAVLGAFLHGASLILARLVAWPDSLVVVPHLCWILPAVYVASDLCDDTLIFVLLSFERQTFPEHLPSERLVIDPPAACECCGSNCLRKLREDVTRTLEV